MTLPGLAVKVSQMLGPLPSLLAPPSIWYDAVLVPNLKPGGNESVRAEAPEACVSPTGTISQMTVEIRRGTDRFVDRATGRRTLHAFSFGSWYDAERLSFGPMVCHDEHLLRDGEGFDDHPHSDLVIVSWVLSGALRHTDTTGTSAVLTPGDVGVLHTGAAVAHSEVAAAPQTRFVQVWLTPAEPGGETTYDVRPAPDGTGAFLEVARPIPGATLWLARLEAGQTVTTPAAPKVHVFVARGALLRSSLAEPLHDGDAFLFTDETSYDLTAGVPTELLCWTFD
jgi:quercetin 2,3-dioxygenase